MKKTVLLVFIHGFKGGDDTFGTFPEHIRMLLGRSLPAVKVTTAVYPKYETRGSLKESVNVFRDWLQNQVIDLEVANRSASPTVDPSVHTFLVGHSMGGIVAAETLLLLASEQPIPARSSARKTPADNDPLQDSATVDGSPLVEPGSFMFPHVQGVFAFDTPYLGIAPGVVSYNAEGHLKNISSTYTAFSEVAGLFGFGGGNSSNNDKKNENKGPATNNTIKVLPPAVAAGPNGNGGTTSDGDAAATPSWQRWGRYAMFAGAAGAVAAGGAAAMYSQRQRLTDGWGWVSSHLVFVGCLARPAELRERLALLSDVCRDRGISCVNFYTCLGKNASALEENESSNSKVPFSQKIIRSKLRTFCDLPFNGRGQDRPESLAPGLEWVMAMNDKATDEITAHTCMFLPKQNPAFNELVNSACTAMLKSIDRGWYTTATGTVDKVDTEMPRTEKGRTQSQSESGPIDGDDDVVVVD